MADGALAVEGPWGIDAFAPATKTRRPSTLVHIHADLHHGRDLEARVTLTGEASLSVNAGAVAADTEHDVAFVYVDTGDAMLVECIALVAAAAV